MNTLSITKTVLMKDNGQNEFGAGLQLQSIRKINDHDIDIFNRCIDRLNDRFRKLAITLK